MGRVGWTRGEGPCVVRRRVPALSDPIRRRGRPRPVLDRATIEATVISVVGNRAKRRRLAQTLLYAPTVLVDERSPAPASRMC